MTLLRKKKDLLLSNIRPGSGDVFLQEDSNVRLRRPIRSKNILVSYDDGVSYKPASEELLEQDPRVFYDQRPREMTYGDLSFMDNALWTKDPSDNYLYLRFEGRDWFLHSGRYTVPPNERYEVGYFNDFEISVCKAHLYVRRQKQMGAPCALSEVFDGTYFFAMGDVYKKKVNENVILLKKKQEFRIPLSAEVQPVPFYVFPDWETIEVGEFFTEIQGNYAGLKVSDSYFLNSVGEIKHVDHSLFSSYETTRAHLDSIDFEEISQVDVF